MEVLIRQVSLLWANEFPDIPCLTQKIEINALTDTSPIKFKILLSSVGTTLRIEPFTRHEISGFKSLMEEHYSITMDDKDGSLLIDISDKFDGKVSGFSLQCLETPLDPMKIVALQCDFDMPDLWTVCYNSLDRKTSLLKKLYLLISKSSNQAGVNLLKFIYSIFEGKEGIALAIYEKTIELRQNQSMLQPLVSRFHRQLNAHGMKRTFQFWSTEQKQAYLHGSQILIKVLTNKFPNTCIGFGAALGLERDADLIGHDDDIDILVALPLKTTKHLPNALSLVGTHLQKHNFKIEGVFFSHLWVRTPLGERVDVFVGLIEDNERMSFYPSERHSLLYGQVFPAKMSDLYGVNLPFPRLQKEYLRQTYGENWTLPNSRFAHPWDRSTYSDLDGPRRTPAIRTRGEMSRVLANNIQQDVTIAAVEN